MKLTAVVLTKNEASQIGDLIDSLTFCDQVVVVDDYSTDDTRRIAQEKGAQVFKRHLDGDFAAQRNLGLTKAKGDWVLFVDADEQVSAALQTEILEATKNREMYGYYLKRNDLFMGKQLKYGETAQIWLLRLAQKKAGTWSRPVHETWKIPQPVAKLKNPLLHKPHASIESFLTKINLYTSLESRYRKDHGQGFSWIELVLFPVGKFFRNYVLAQGFRDGIPGLSMAYMMSLHSFMVRVKLYEISN